MVEIINCSEGHLEGLLTSQITSVASMSEGNTINLARFSTCSIFINISRYILVHGIISTIKEMSDTPSGAAL